MAHELACGLSQTIHHLLSPSSLETVYIALDFWHDFFGTQTGISIFDPRKFSPEIAEPTLPTFNYVTGTKSYYTSVLSNFDYGVANWITPSHILKNLVQHIPKDRNIVFVFHGRKENLKILREIGFDFGSYSNIQGFLDTNSIAGELGIRDERLGCLRECWGFTKGKREVSVAGNEANFTVRVLILRALVAYEEGRREMVGVPLWRRVAFKVLALERRVYGGPRIVCEREDEGVVIDVEVDEWELVDIDCEEWESQSEVVQIPQNRPSRDSEENSGCTGRGFETLIFNNEPRRFYY